MTAPADPKALVERLRVPSKSRGFADDAAMREAADAIASLTTRLADAERERDEGRERAREVAEDVRAVMAGLTPGDAPGTAHSRSASAGIRPMSAPHLTKPVRVWADVDVGIADFVVLLNEIPGIRTSASCQGTIGEGGAEPYGPQVMVTWEDDAALARLSKWRVTKLGAHFGYVHPNESERYP